MNGYLKKLLSRAEDSSSQELLSSTYSFHYASTIGELLMIIKTHKSISPEILDEINAQLGQSKKKFEDQTFISALKEGIQELIDAHRQEFAKIESLVECDGFYEIEMILAGRDRLEYTSEAVKHYGDNEEIRKAIEGYSDLDEILRSHIQKIFSEYKNDFLAKPPVHWFPETFWWRPDWSRIDLNLT